MFAVRLAFALLLSCAIFRPVSNLAEAPSSDLRVMSFNIRYGTAIDGENQWDRRKEFLIATIKAFDPDLLGTQETLGFQRNYIAQKFPDFEVLGVGRDDGKEEGEMTALYFKRSRFEKLDGGHFWLSETPDQPGSKSWDTSLTRMVTWVKLRDRLQPKRKPLMYFNTHFDHRGVQARIESARLIRNRVVEAIKTCRAIVTGDFNMGEGSEAYKALFDPIEGQPSPLRDSFRIANPTRAENEGTFNGFKPESTNGPRIDWIGVSKEWKVVTAAIDHTTRNGHTPSDHFPMTVVLRP